MDKSKKVRAVAVAAAVLLCGTAYFYTSYRQGAGSAPDFDTIVTESFLDGEKNHASASPETADDSASGEREGDVYVHVCGEVKKPGVYTFDREPRVIEAVKKAGGFTKRADKSSINQAESVPDGTRLFIETVGAGKKQSGDREDAAGGEQPGASRKVNINTASEAELMTLSGIGQSRAVGIISYREKNGNFRKIEDIMKISGIKTGIFDKIKEYITV